MTAKELSVFIHIAKSLDSLVDEFKKMNKSIQEKTDQEIKESKLACIRHRKILNEAK